jgi:hypothetical protein
MNNQQNTNNADNQQLNISDVSDSLIGKIVKYNGEDCEIMYKNYDKTILRSIEKYVKIEGSEPVHNFYKVDLSELNYH